jgi:hypothetical protein
MALPTFRIGEILHINRIRGQYDETARSTL